MSTGRKATPRYRRLAGLSLVELMVVVALMGILAAIAVPSMIDLIRDARLATQSDMLVSALNTARLEAVKQRTDFRVCPAEKPSSATACSDNAADWSKGWIVIAGDTVAWRNEAKPGLTVTTASAATTFTGTLGSAAAATAFTLCFSGRHQHMVTVTLSGHVGKRVADAVCA